MNVLRLTSIQAPNQDFIVTELAGYLEKRLGQRCEFRQELPWRERERMLDAGAIDVGWICGLPYVRKVDRPNANLTLLAAPVMAAPRYHDRPIYFSDVVVRSDSPYQTFSDLRGTRWAYNEPNSQSGYNITRYHLATLGETAGYFGSVIAAGSHEAALDILLSGEIDASAIDSTVLEIVLRHRPQLQERLRIVATLGPSPIPPWVIQNQTPDDLTRRLRHVLLHMHEQVEGRAILAACAQRRFAAVNDSDYDPVRMMAREAKQVLW